MRLNKRTFIIIMASLVVIILIFLMLMPKNAPQATTSSGATATVEDASTVHYTDAISNQSGTDLPSKAIEFTRRAPEVSIAGLDALFKTSLPDEQVNTLQATLTSFILARSGIAIAGAGIKNDTTNYVDAHTFNFTLVTIRPQATYLVTVTADETQTVVTPTVTFKQVE